MDERPSQQPEGALIQQKQGARSARELAAKAGISDSRWRHIVSGRQPAGEKGYLPIKAPAGTLARMAHVVGATPSELDDVGRADAADELRRILSMPDVTALPPLPPELHDLVELYVTADDGKRRIIRGQVRLLLDDLRGIPERRTES